MWAIALGSGTSGGVFAPFLIIGGCLGAIEAGFLPGHDVQLCALIGMAGVLSGPLRAPLTGAIFALEFTYDTGALVPLGARLDFVLRIYRVDDEALDSAPRKLCAAGLHVSQEFGVDPLERLNVGQVMSSTAVTIPAGMPIPQLVQAVFPRAQRSSIRAIRSCRPKAACLGVITNTDLLDEWAEGLSPDQAAQTGRAGADYRIRHDEQPGRSRRFSHETCRAAVERMVQTGIGRLVVVDPDNPTRILGMTTRSDVLKSRARLVDEEKSRERILCPRVRRLRNGEPRQKAIRREKRRNAASATAFLNSIRDRLESSLGGARASS